MRCLNEKRLIVNASTHVGSQDEYCRRISSYLGRQTGLELIAPQDHSRVLNTLRYIHANPKAAGM